MVPFCSRLAAAVSHCYLWAMGSTFLPTAGLLRDIANALDREPSDPVVIPAFDQLVLRGQLAPWRPRLGELLGWEPSELEGVLQRGR
jgi:hypothetical protein